MVLKAAWESNGGDLIKSITAALMTLGGLHAPVKKVYNLLYKLQHNNFDVVLCQYNVVPGFGSDFVRGAPDPMLNDTAEALYQENRELYDYGTKIHKHLGERGKVLYPNLGFYTAAVAMHEGYNVLFCEKILIETRINEWIRMLENY
jgi:citrate synthase